MTDHVVTVLGIDGAGVSLTHDDEGLTFVTATDATIAAIEEAQVDLHEGPCHEAFHTGEVVTIDDLTDDHRWPNYRDAAVAHDVRAAAGIPMPVGDQHIGVLNLYRRAPGPWKQQELDVAQLLADMASGYVLNATQVAESHSLTEQFQHALDSRILVEQAKGVLAERKHITVHEAFETMRRHARHTGTRIHKVRQQVIEGPLDL